VAGSNTCQTTCDVSRGIDDRDRPSEGQVSKIKARRHIGHREIGVRPEVRKETGHRKSRNPDTIGTVHLRGRVAGDWCHRRKARQEVVHRLIGNRDIGDPGHKGFVHFEIAIREIPMSGVQLSAQQRRRTEA
jgi:hypothetical protein